MKRFMLIFTLLALVPILAFGANGTKRSVPTYQNMTGDETVTAPSAEPSSPEIPAIDEADLIGDTTTLGMTWYGNQHNGTCGRMNVLEATGWRQFAWMKGYESGATNRHVWWNGIDPNGLQVFPGNGVAIESSLRGGFVNLDVGSNGAGFPAYHNTTSQSGGLPQTAISMDLIPHAGAFLDFQAPPTPYTQIIWPRIAINQNQRIHIVSTQSTAAAGNPQRQYYIGANYNPTTLTVTYDPSWTFMDWTMTIAADVAASPVAGSNKTLWAWTRSRVFGPGGPSNPDSTYTQLDNDVYYLIDADGVAPNFNSKVNLTNFIPPNPSYLPDTLVADRDTLRAYTDLNTFIDANNYAHIAFTTRSYFYYEGTTYWNASLIWHWSEQFPDSFRVVGSESYFAYNNNIDCGAWNLKAQRPSLGQAANGNLYCMYQVYDTDTTHQSAGGFPSGDIYISYSTNGGITWTQGTNVTSTITPNLAPAGSCWSELTPTMAKKVDTYCHIEYVVDKDAGNVLQTEGTWTNNPVRYHRVPVASLNSTALVQSKRLHVLPVAPPPILDVLVTPVNPPIVIPANGGTFSFNATVTRTQPPQAPFWVWARDRYPNGTTYVNTLGPVQINPPVGANINRLRQQNVPNTWPAGIHTYLGYANNTVAYPAIDSSYFTWTKLADFNNGPIVWDATCFGEAFPGEEMAAPAQKFSLDGAYPNPFNPTTTISFVLPAASMVKLTVFDTAGREVATLVNGQRDAGRQQVTFDGSDLASGVYFAKLQAGDFTSVSKLMLMK